MCSSKFPEFQIFRLPEFRLNGVRRVGMKYLGLLQPECFGTDRNASLATKRIDSSGSVSGFSNFYFFGPKLNLFSWTDLETGLEITLTKILKSVEPFCSFASKFKAIHRCLNKHFFEKDGRDEDGSVLRSPALNI